MEKVQMTQKALILMAKNLNAIDITTAKIPAKESSQFECIAISVGIYGINGALFTKKGKFYVIKKRATNIFVLL